MTWTFEMSEFCNMACTYCDADINNPLTSTKEMFDIFNKEYLKDSVPYKFDLYGGEPFLQMDLVNYIVNILKDDNNCNIIHIPTNGTIMNDDIIKLSKIDKVQIILSHDGMNQVLNRGNQKVYIEEFKNLKIIKVHSMLVGENFYKNSNFLVRNHLYLNILGMNPDLTIVRDIGTFNKEQVQYFLEDFEKYCIFISDKINNDEYKEFINLPGLIKTYLSNMLEKAFYDHNKKDCGIGDTYIVHKPDGEIVPCYRMTRNSDVYETFKKGDHLRIMSKCDTCDIRDICHKGCLYEHIKNNQVIEELCDLYKGIYKILKILIKDTDYKILKLFKGN